LTLVKSLSAYKLIATITESEGMVTRRNPEISLAESERLSRER
jgi:hypothetical protein